MPVVIIAGTRYFDDEPLLYSKCDLYTSKLSGFEVISGVPLPEKRWPQWKPGADGLGEQWAKERGHPFRPFPADWETHGRAAGPLRNREMAEYAKASGEGYLIAFWDEVSKGTKDMIGVAVEKGLRVKVILYTLPAM